MPKHKTTQEDLVRYYCEAPPVEVTKQSHSKGKIAWLLWVARNDNGKISHKLVALLVFLCSFVVYLLTLYPNMPWGDPGFLAICARILGIPHPPSFPIYVLWGRLFNLIPINNPAWQTNLMSAFWGSLGLVLLYYLIVQVFNQLRKDNREMGRLTQVYPTECHPEESIGRTKQSHSKDEIAGNDNQKGFSLHNFILTASAVSGVLGLGFASAFWLQTTRTEVYTLNFLFFILVLYLLLKWSFKADFKIMALACFVYGLSFANHSFLMMSVFPAFLVFVVMTNFREMLKPKSLAVLFGLFLVAVSVYLFLLIRANQWPAINSGTPDSWRGLFSSITRSSDLPHVIRRSPYENRFWFCLSFPVHQFSLLFFGWGILGMVKILRTNWRVWTMLLFIFICNILTSTLAADFSLLNEDILGYLLPSLAVFALFVSFGFYYTCVWLVDALKKRTPVLGKGLVCFFVVLCLSLPTFQLFRNLEQCNQSKNNQSYEFGKEILNSVRGNALILTISDYTLHTFWYLVHAEKTRPDVKIIGVGMRRHKSYIREIEKQYPEVKLPPNSQEVKDLGSLQQFLYELCRLNVGEMPIYYDFYYGERPFLNHLVPHGFLLEYKQDEVDISDLAAQEHYAYFKRYFDLHAVGQADAMTRQFFGTFVFNLGVFYSKIGRSEYADKFIRLSFDISPDNASLYYSLARNLIGQKQFDLALIFLQAAAKMDPYNEEFYYSLAHCYYEKGDIQRTEEMLIKARTINPRDTSIQGRLDELKALKRKGQK